MNALEEGRPSNLNNKMITELEDDVADPLATNTAPKPSLMKRSSTAHTYEVNFASLFNCFTISFTLLSSVFMCLNS